MQRSLIFILPVLVLATACGTYSGYTSQQRYADGIYTRYAAQEDPRPLYSVDDFDAMARRNFAAKQKNGTASRDTVYVVLEDNRTDYAWNAFVFGSLFYPAWYYGPWRYGFRHYYPWRYYDPWYYDAWVWNDPWYYRPWHYDPW